MPLEYIFKPISAVISTPARALCSSGLDYTNVYQNTLPRPRLILVTCWHVVGNAANVCRVHAYIGTTSSPADWECSGGDYDPEGLGVPHSFMLFVVPAWYYYRVCRDDGAGNLSELNRWSEVQL